MKYPNCNIDESKIVFTINEDGDIFSKQVLGDIIIAVKVPGTGPTTFYKRGFTPHHHVIFTGVYDRLEDDGWIEGLPKGFSGFDCTGEDDKSYAILTMP